MRDAGAVRHLPRRIRSRPGLTAVSDPDVLHRVCGESRRPQRGAGCHGADGKGDRAKMIPNLTGQPPGYLRNQLLLFKQDQRSPGDADLKAAKQVITTIPEETLSDLAAYFSSLR